MGVIVIIENYLLLREKNDCGGLVQSYQFYGWVRDSYTEHPQNLNGNNSNNTN